MDIAGITEVKVRLGLTHSLPGYGNVRPEVEFTAQIGEKDDPAAVLHSLGYEARVYVEEVVDNYLEKHNEAPFYAPAYQVITSADRKAAVVVPLGTRMPTDGLWTGKIEWATRSLPIRWETAVTVARSVAKKEGLGFYDCSDGDVSKIPEPIKQIKQTEVFWKQKHLGSRLASLGIPDGYWEVLAELEHVTLDYLNRLYEQDVESILPTKLLLKMIEDGSEEVADYVDTIDDIPF